MKFKDRLFGLLCSIFPMAAMLTDAPSKEEMERFRKESLQRQALEKGKHDDQTVH